MQRRTRFRRGSLAAAAAGSLAGDAGIEGMGVVARASNGSGFRLCRRRVAGGDGGGLGGRWCWEACAGGEWGAAIV